jgi:hypothetical protein
VIDFLYANGDSWTYGNGIDEDPAMKDLNLHVPLSTEQRTDLAWAGHLGRHLGVRVKNASLGGSSNARIVRTTCDFLQKYPKDAYNSLLVVIGWTTVERSEIYIDRTGYDDYYAFNAAQRFSDQFNGNNPGQIAFNKVVDSYQKDYVKYVYSNQQAMSNYFIQLTQMRHLLENLGIKYLFFNAIPWHWLKFQETKEFEERLLPHSNEKFIGSLTHETMTSFVEQNNFAMSSCRHPMVQGHKAWAERLYTDLKRIYPNDVT